MNLPTISRIAARANKTLLLLAPAALAGSLAFAQAPAPPAAPPPQAQGQPQPGQGRGMRPDMDRSMQGRTDMRDGGKDRGGFNGGGHSGFSGGHGGFRGPGGDAMGGAFHIAPAGMWWKNPGTVQKLSLTAEQTKKMDDIFQQSRLQLIDLKANVEKQNVILEPMLSANPPDTAKTLAQIDKVAQARADLEKADARMLLGIRGVLTPDQWTKLHTPTPRGGQPASGANGGPAPGQPGRPTGAQNNGPGGGGRGFGPGHGPGGQGNAETIAPNQ